MSNYIFWRDWPQPFRAMAYVLFILLLGFVAIMLGLLVIGPEGLIGWHTFSQRFPVDTVTQLVEVGPFHFSFPEQLFVIKEFVSGSSIALMPWASVVNLLIVIAAFSVFVSLISYFNRWGFLAFSGIIFTFIIYLHPEMLQIASIGDKWLLGIIFLLYAGPSYYFQSFNQESPFAFRLAVFLMIGAMVAIMAATQSHVIAPLQAFMGYGILAPYLVVLLFVLMVGHEVVNGFLMGIAGSKDNQDNNRIKHFLIITFIYLINLLLAYLEITHVINWGFITLNPFVILAFAGVLGLWGINQRFVLYQKVNSDQKVWVFLYLVVAVLSFSTISYLMLTLEDPMLKIIGDFIIFTQLSLGLAFMLYILYNFIPVIEKGYGMKDILYKPQNLPHFTYRLVGMVILTALVLMRDIKYPIWYSMGGFYNSIADYFYKNGDTDTAGIFYEKGSDLSLNNHKSNYMLGMIHIDNDHELAIEKFSKASKRVPTAQAFINKANLESDEGLYFDALFTLQEGAKRLGRSNEIQNNLGLQFSKANVLDSAWYYYKSAFPSSEAQNNALTFVLQHNFQISNSDSASLFKNLDNVGKSNASALGWRPHSLDSISGDNMIAASMLNNLMVNGLPLQSDAMLQGIRTVVDSTKNPDFSEELSYTLALFEMRNGRITDALLRLQKLVSLGTKKQAVYYETLGLINLEHRSYDEASTFFYLAEQAGSKTILEQLAVAQTEAGYFDEALLTWNRVEESGDDNIKLKASIMKQVLQSIVNYNDSISGDDISLYLKARYQRLWVDEYTVKATFDQISDENLKNQLALDLAISYFDSGNMEATKLFYETINPEVGKEVILRPLLYLNIRLAYAGLIPDLDMHLNQFEKAGFNFRPDEYLQKIFYQTNRQEIPDEVAQKLASDDPYFAEGVVWAAKHFEIDEDIYRSYNIVLEALDKNPDNRLLLEDYILRAIDLGLEQYAEQSLLHYRELFPGTQYNVFMLKVNAHRETFSKMFEDEDS